MRYCTVHGIRLKQRLDGRSCVHHVAASQQMAVRALFSLIAAPRQRSALSEKGDEAKAMKEGRVEYDSEKSSGNGEASGCI
jgi:hypothetical protein